MLRLYWESVVSGMTFAHPDPDTYVRVRVVPRPRNIRILFTLHNLVDSVRGQRIEAFEYYFYADHWPGAEKARLWILSAWELLMEHETLEMSGADPHNSPGCVEHRAALDRRHDISFMISRMRTVDSSSVS